MKENRRDFIKKTAIIGGVGLSGAQTVFANTKKESVKNSDKTKEKENIVFLMAHPDDVAIQIGGTAMVLKEKYNLHVLCVSKGERGIKGKTYIEAAAIREKEEAAACKIMSAKLTFLNQIDGEIFAGREACEKTAELLKELKPVALFTHWPMEKADHAATFHLAWQALQISNLYWTTEIYFPVFRGQFSNVHAEIFVDISKVTDEKRKLLECHKSQISKEKADTLLSNNKFIGKLGWVGSAEAFYSGSPLVANRWGRKADSILLDL